MRDTKRCRDFLKHLSSYVDKDLEPAICRHIEAHMKGCKPCLAFIRTLKKTVGVLHRQRPAAPSARMKAELRRRLAGLERNHGRGVLRG